MTLSPYISKKGQPQSNNAYFHTSDWNCSLAILISGLIILICKLNKMVTNSKYVYGFNDFMRYYSLNNNCVSIQADMSISTPQYAAKMQNQNTSITFYPARSPCTICRTLQASSSRGSLGRKPRSSAPRPGLQLLSGASGAH